MFQSALKVSFFPINAACFGILFFNALTFTHFKCDWSVQTLFGTTVSEFHSSKVGKDDRKWISTGLENINPSFTTFAADESSHHRVSNVVFRLDCFLSESSWDKCYVCAQHATEFRAKFFYNECINIRLSFQTQEAVCLFLYKEI